MGVLEAPTAAPGHHFRGHRSRPHLQKPALEEVYGTLVALAQPRRFV